MLDPIHDDTTLVDELNQRLTESLTLKKGGAKKLENKVSNSDHSIQSWKFNEWDYYKNLVPCKARGLFIVDGKIAVRGYNKFFNMNEVPETKIESLSSTRGPYNLTVKENGCIIFISGLEDGTILVCSKHSSGYRLDLTRNHALEGEAQLLRHLSEHSLDVKDLARYLFQYNITLVCELCDDSFEEHILSYKNKDAGLYLHGINHNTIEFQTYPMEFVQEFAKKWGFKFVESFTIDKFDNLMEFLKSCESTGTWNNKEIEGFVIRCKMPNTNGQLNDFFFKFKFEQPYLLYRNFREVTKQYLNGKSNNEILKKFHNEKFIVAKYLEFTKNYFINHPEAKESYLNGHGIIELRKEFLHHLGLNENSGINLLNINEELKKTSPPETLKNKLVLIPIATIGCGKTTVGNVLTDLFNWGHIQNDNINSKNKTQLVIDSLKELIEKDVVLVDRNNHMKRERQQLFDQFNKFKLDWISPDYNLVFVALNFIPPGFDKSDLTQITYERIFKRGDNHQSIKSETDPELAAKILSGFVSRFQPLQTRYEPDSEFDLVINLDFRQETNVAVEAIIKELKTAFPEVISTIPTEEQLKSAVVNAQNYKPTFTKLFGKTSTKSTRRKVDYFGVSIDGNVIKGLLNEINHPSWVRLQELERVNSEFHITLMHSSALSEHQKEWETLHRLLSNPKGSKKGLVPKSDSIQADIRLLNVVLSPKLICIEVEILSVYKKHVDNQTTTVNIPVLSKVPHITVGTFSPDIKPVESNQVLADWKSGLANDVEIIPVSEPIYHQELFPHYPNI